MSLPTPTRSLAPTVTPTPTTAVTLPNITPPSPPFLSKRWIRENPKLYRLVLFGYLLIILVVLLFVIPKLKKWSKTVNWNRRINLKWYAAIGILIVSTIVMIALLVWLLIRKLRSAVDIDNNYMCFIRVIPPLRVDMNTVDLHTYNRQIAETLSILSLGTNSWSICSIKFAPPTLPGFELVATGKVYNSISKTYVDNTLAYYSKAMDTIVISFAGSSTFEQWVEDAKIGTSHPTFLPDSADFKEVQIQTTYWKAYRSIRTLVMQILQNLLGPKTKILTTGHSLGGAFASIFYIDLITHNIANERRALYAFGMPRTGNKRFAEVINFDNSSYRISNNEDIVPALPFPVMFDAHYTHIGTNVDFSMNYKQLSLNHVVAYADYFRPAVLTKVLK